MFSNRAVCLSHLVVSGLIVACVVRVGIVGRLRLTVGRDGQFVVLATTLTVVALHISLSMD